jgi:predicted transcriptional regulator
MEQKYLNLLIMAEMINNDNASVDELARYFGRKYWSIENYKRTLMELGLIYE